MNAQGDDHVSFSAAHLALQGQYLLVSTDGPRIIMYNITGASPDTLNVALSHVLQFTERPVKLQRVFYVPHKKECPHCELSELIVCSMSNPRYDCMQIGSRNGASSGCQWRSSISRWRSGTRLATTSLQQPLTALCTSSMSVAQR